MTTPELLRRQAELARIKATAPPTPPPGRLASRFAAALARGKGDQLAASEIASRARWVDADAIKAAIAAVADADNVEGLHSPIGADFISLIRPLTLLGRIEGLRTVPFLVRSVTQMTGPAASWTPEGFAVPVQSATFTEAAGLHRRRLAAIAVVTAEAADNSTLEGHLLTDLGRATAEGLDAGFIDPANGGIPDTQPASITSGATTIPSSGNDAASARADLLALFGSYGGDLLRAVFVMHPMTALQLSLLQAPLGRAELGLTGGMLFGLPVIASESVPRDSSGSPITLLDPDSISIALSASELRVATQTSIQMLDDPTGSSATPTATTLVSLWQSNSIGLMGSVHADWRVGRDSAVVVLTWR